MTKLLRQAIAKIEQLTPEEQDRIAIRIIDESTNFNLNPDLNFLTKQQLTTEIDNHSLFTIH